jgi:hypothetical protein
MRARSQALVAALAGLVGADELVLGVALALIATGLWQTWRPGAVLVPGVVLLWIALPARAGFITRLPGHTEKPPRRKD